MQPDAEKRKEALSGLIKIVALESTILAVVVVVYIATQKLNYLIGGIIGAQIIVVPLFINWAREKAPALKAPKEWDR